LKSNPSIPSLITLTPKNSDFGLIKKFITLMELLRQPRWIEKEIIDLRRRVIYIEPTELNLAPSMHRPKSFGYRSGIRRHKDSVCSSLNTRDEKTNAFYYTGWVSQTSTTLVFYDEESSVDVERELSTELWSLSSGEISSGDNGDI
jgi:hypothetical protein